LSLQRKDREVVLHGNEKGTIYEFATGEYIELHEPVDEQDRWVRVNYTAHAPLEIEPAEDSRGVRRKGYKADRRWQALSRFFYEDRVEPVRPSEVHQPGAHTQVGSDTEKPAIAE